ncbi:MAG: ABC transporter permease [Acidimicrobiales bacterium]|nr:ABC transporter permease [Acidimicrobiales bacterium]
MAAQATDLTASAPVLTDTVVGVGAPRRKWTRNLEVYIPAGILIFIIGGCFLGPILWPVPAPVGGNVINANLPVFAHNHIFGTDPVGNDILSRIMYGGRVSFEISFGTVALGTVVGGLLGTFAAISAGWAESLIMRIMDVLIAFPSLVLVLVLAQALKPSEINVIWALAFFAIPAVSRLARSAALRVREMDYMLAAKLSGTSKWRILTRHMAPNVLPQLLTIGLLAIGLIIMLEAALSYLGFSIPPPQPSWGNMINLGQSYLSSNPDLVLIPCAFLFVTIVCLNMLSDAARARYATL